MVLLRLGLIIVLGIGTPFAAVSGPPPQLPDYPLFAVSIEASYTPEELAQIAVWFTMTHGHLPADQVTELHRLNPDFRVFTHINSSYTSSSDPGQVPIIEADLRDAIGMYAVADLRDSIDSTQARFRLQPNGQTPLILRASTIVGPTSAPENSTRNYVTWIRIDDELMRVEAWNSDQREVSVTRGFAGSEPSSHHPGSAVLSPVYIGQKGRAWSGYYPGGPNTVLRFALRQDHTLTHEFMARQAIHRLEEGMADGIWWDIMSSGFFNQSNMDGQAVRQWNFETGAPYRQEAYRDHLQLKAQRVRDLIEGAVGHRVPMVGNNFSGTYFPEDGNDRLLGQSTMIKPNPLDGLVFEGFPGEFFKDHFRTGESMIRNIQKVIDLEARRLPGLLAYDNCASRRSTNAEERAQKQRFEEYGYAAFLMGAEPGGTVQYGIAAYRRPSLDEPEPHLWLHPQYFYGIGRPLESLAHTDIELYRLPGSNTFCRAFEHAFVFVNVDADSVDVVDLIALEKVGKSLIDPVSGGEVTELQIGPHSGVILMRP